MSRQDKLLMLLLGSLGAWAWIAARQRREWIGGYLTDATGTAVEYAGAAAQNLIEQARELVSGLTRGERNNNPGNIRRSADAWQGLAPVQSDPAFFVFADPQSGIRALGKTLLTYQDRYGLRTITALISRWAPMHENPTASYISNVAAATGYLPGEQLELHDPQTLTLLAQAIIAQENGRLAYPQQTIHAGIAAALS